MAFSRQVVTSLQRGAQGPGGAGLMAPAVEVVFARYPADVRERLTAVRALIFETAATTAGVGPLTETLKWGEPAYLTEASKSGSTIRLGWKPPGICAVYFNCKTTLVESFRAAFPEAFAFEGDRALLIGPDGPLPRAPLAQCLALALTYHSRKHAAARPAAVGVR
jgi:hypothetical protein